MHTSGSNKQDCHSDTVRLMDALRLKRRICHCCSPPILYPLTLSLISPPYLRSLAGNWIGNRRKQSSIISCSHGICPSPAFQTAEELIALAVTLQAHLNCSLTSAGLILASSKSDVHLCVISGYLINPWRLQTSPVIPHGTKCLCE